MKLCGFEPICRLYIVDSILHWRSHDAAIQGPRFMSQIEVPYGAAIWGPRCLCFAPDVIETYHILNRYSHLDGETTTIYHKFYFVILEILMKTFWEIHFDEDVDISVRNKLPERKDVPKTRRRQWQISSSTSAGMSTSLPILSFELSMTFEWIDEYC